MTRAKKKRIGLFLVGWPVVLMLGVWASQWNHIDVLVLLTWLTIVGIAGSFSSGVVLLCDAYNQGEEEAWSCARRKEVNPDAYEE